MPPVDTHFGSTTETAATWTDSQPNSHSIAQSTSYGGWDGQGYNGWATTSGWDSHQPQQGWGSGNWSSHQQQRYAVRDPREPKVPPLSGHDHAPVCAHSRCWASVRVGPAYTRIPEAHAVGPPTPRPRRPPRPHFTNSTFMFCKTKKLQLPRTLISKVKASARCSRAHEQ